MGRIAPDSRWRVAVAAVAAVLCVAAPATSQYLKRVDPKTPRLADGTPNMTAPTPRLPGGRVDLNGLWPNKTIRSPGRNRGRRQPVPSVVELCRVAGGSVVSGLSERVRLSAG
jgi:hypothetical protein